MLQIKKLYSEPKVFEPITFKDGFNLILGETTEGNEKTNGVGKSMAIEFINYALLKRHNDSRVSLIPKEDLSRDTAVCLDFEINGHYITSRRVINNHECPTLIIDGKIKSYSRLADATDHLSTLIFEGVGYENLPSFRIMMGPLIRDEGSEFKSIINCFDTNKRIPADYTPHLFLLQVDPSPYSEAKRLYSEMENISKARKKMEENITALTNKNVSESKADLNELENQVRRIQGDIDNLENIEGFDTVKDEIVDIENQLEQQRSKQGVLKSELSKIKLFRGDNYIDGQEVADLYNQFKEGLGDLIKRELSEVTAFKQKIDNFQRSIMDDRKSSIEREIKVFEESISSLNKLYREKISLLDQEGLLVSLKQTIAIHEKKVEEFSALSSFIRKHADYDSEHKAKKRERESEIYLLESFVNNSKQVIDSFEKTILDMHDYIFGNRRSSFDIEVSKRKEILKFELRTDSDGSHSINREKVFLYDFSLLINPETSKHHPGLLVHDNIFDVDQDTLIQSINYIGENIKLLSGKQYILTINSDKFSSSDLELLNINLNDYSRAAFTKESRFLKIEYQELPR
ncbi:DUF2326 domain-containing protein [Kangiella koreensis]|uniref:DUF2326 domain-containing protein n=1 Tax=Kangiella koreensis (strain DSM 16069 / JCM 12317 / KCTC 12182 / SW-125) TaxID=523791 RepID=C7R6V5_KANKD|nr:DUF2326 domain-containing protein [Kangiella koreensis]ACV25621.1 conserved hypothetical protein [Kangiella koreensis DSM 16069]